jgi:hypothetical protein
MRRRGGGKGLAGSNLVNEVAVGESAPHEDAGLAIPAAKWRGGGFFLGGGGERVGEVRRREGLLAEDDV